MSNWSRETILFFLECYQAESCIWNPKDKQHKDKIKVVDAWNRLSRVLKKPVKEIKRKKEILMTTFRKHLKTKQESIRSGADAEDIHAPIWFAYQQMENFLLPVYTSKNTLKTKTQLSVTSLPEIEEMKKETEEIVEIEEDPLVGEDTDHTLPSTSSATSTPKLRRHAPDFAERQMATTFGQLTNVLSKPQPPPQEDEECDLYVKLLAIKLRELPSNDRKIFMYKIDGLFVNRIQQSSFTCETPSLSPQYSSLYRTPSASSVHILNQPSSTQTSYSKPLASRTSIPKRPSIAKTSHYESLTTNFNSKSRRISTQNLPPSQYTNKKLIPLNKPDSSNLHSPVYKIALPQSMDNVSATQNNILLEKSSVPIHIDDDFESSTDIFE